MVHHVPVFNKLEFQDMQAMLKSAYSNWNAKFTFKLETSFRKKNVIHNLWFKKLNVSNAAHSIK